MPELSSWETLYLWHLIGRGGTAAWGDRPVSSIQARHRRALQRHGLIEEKKGARGAISAEVTDAGWAWAGEHLDSALPESRAAAPVLRDWLAVLGNYLSTHRLGVGDLFVAAPDTGARSTESALVDRIREHYLAHTNGRWRHEVRIADLKRGFSPEEHEAVDKALVALAKQGAAELMRIDDPTDIRSADESAAVSIGGEVRHLVFLHSAIA